MNKKRTNWLIVACMFLLSTQVNAQQQTEAQMQPRNKKTTVDYAEAIRDYEARKKADDSRENKSISPSLMGTEWMTKPIRVPWTDGIMLTYIYRFTEVGKVGRLILINQPPGVKFDPFTNRVVPTIGIINNVYSDTGTYTQTGRSVHMEFAQENQDAAIQADEMAGYNRSKTDGGSGSNLAFVAQRLFTETNQWRELTASALVGTWEGSFNQTSCTLVIDKSEGNRFSGEIRTGGGRTAFTGTVEDSTTHRISFTGLGSNLGFVDNIGKALRGAGGNGGNIYSWDFSKKEISR